MARKTRFQLPGVLRHVMARGNGKMPIFLDDQDYRRFVFLLGDVVEEFEIECWNYCVMPNHYHATIRPRHANISIAMRKLNSRYAQWWNRRHERVGHAFQGRFKDQIVQEDSYALALSRYVARNPLRAGLVERPEDWRWSSYGSTAGIETVPSFLSVSSTLRMFGDADPDVLRRRFIEFVLEDAGDEAAADRIRSAERVIGTAAFKLEIRDQTDFENEKSQDEERSDEIGATTELEERSSP
ncbi:MAG: transposase [Vicinamibacterales bacterium]